jgi:hypothetical protein
MKKARIIHHIIALFVVLYTVSCSSGDADIQNHPYSSASRGECHIQLDCIDAFGTASFPKQLNADSVEKTLVTVRGKQRHSLYMQAPGVADYEVFILPGSVFSSWVSMAPTAWNGSTDGAVFSVIVISDDPPESVLVWKRLINPRNNPQDRRWHAVHTPLDCWTGKKCTIRLHSDPGHSDDMTKDWCLWGEPLVYSAPLTDSVDGTDQFEAQLEKGIYQYDHDFLVTHTVPSSIEVPDSLIQSRTTAFLLAGRHQEGLYAHPPWSMSRTVLPGPRASFIASLGMIESCWESSDGVLFRVEVTSDPAHPVLLFEYYLNPRINKTDQRWVDIVIDLSAYTGVLTDITLRTTPGYRGDLNCDSVAWAHPAVISIR